MKRAKRILLGLACAALLIASWAAAVTAKSTAERQRELIDQAAAYTADEIYVLAVPLLEEAAGYQDTYTLEAETALKSVYLRLAEKGNYRRRYTNLLDKQMAREGASPDIFREAAQYYLETNRMADALSALKSGIAATQNPELTRFYEDIRYDYTLSRNFYDEAGAIHKGIVPVAQEGAWGLAAATGLPVIPCQYDKISTFDEDRAIVQKDGVISAVDQENNRIALLHRAGSDFGNYAENRAGLKTEEGWILVNGTLQTGSTVFEELGMFSGGMAPAKRDGLWGIVDASGEKWLLEPQYEDIIRDELGRCGDSEFLFVRRGGAVFLTAGKDREEIGGPYEDAHPFNGGWAAVKQNGKWGFIDTSGALQLNFQFEDALSFGQHLAAVQKDGLWGYVSLQGEMVIEPQFLEAKSFSGGSAPVRTGLGWQFITLEEFRQEGGGLF